MGDCSRRQRLVRKRCILSPHGPNSATTPRNTAHVAHWTNIRGWRNAAAALPNRTQRETDMDSAARRVGGRSAEPPPYICSVYMDSLLYATCIHLYIHTYVCQLATRIYTEGGRPCACTLLSCKCLRASFSILVRNADASRHDKAEGPEPPRLYTKGHEYPDGISMSCP